MHEFPRRSGSAQPVTLEQVLQTKEERAVVQAELRARCQVAVVSVSVNMPGTVKYDQDTLALIEYALARLQKLFAIEGFQTLESRWLHAVAGPAAVFAGRLLDIDVFDAGGKQLSRDAVGLGGRRCFVCDEPAILCIRGRRHEAQQIAAAVAMMLEDFRRHGEATNH